MTPPAAPARPPARWPEALFALGTRSAGLVILAVVLGLVGVLVVQSWPALREAGSNGLFTSADWVPKPRDGEPQRFGALAFVYGTVVTSIIAMLLAVPFGVAAAAFLSEIAPPWLRKAGAFLIELLAAIPSVVYGFWGLFFLAPQLQKLFDLLGGPNTGGNGILAAGVILAIMILPYITAISLDVCQSVPRSLREGALALGASRWQTIWKVVLPTARPGILAAAFLALGRALGETMAVTMLIGNLPIIDVSIYASGNTIASKLANSLNEADDPQVRAALIALALVLMAVTAAFNIFGRMLLTRLSRPPRSRASGGADASASADKPELPTPPPPAPPPVSRARLWNRVMTVALSAGFLVTVVPLFLILGLIAVRGVSAIDANLFTERARPELTEDQFAQYKQWQAGEAAYPKDDFGDPVKRGGLGHAMLGSAIMVLLATVLAVPLGLAAAVYLSEARNSRLAVAVRFVTELLGGVPSIVIGLFVYAVLVAPAYPWLRGTELPLNPSAWAGAVALAIMMIPVVVRSAEEAMKLVPDSLRQASYALGANRMQTTMKVILPAALPAIVTGIFLAVGRIAGETAPLLWAAGQFDRWPTSLSNDTPFLTGYIYNYSRSDKADLRDQAWGATVVLLSVVMLVNIVIRMLAGKRVVAAARAD